MNEVYLDMDADPSTGEGSRLKRMTRVDHKGLVTFAGFMDVLMIYECSLKTKIVKRLLDLLKVYHWRLDTVDFFRFLREIARYGYKKWDLVAGRTIQASLLVRSFNSRKSQSTRLKLPSSSKNTSEKY